MTTIRIRSILAQGVATGFRLWRIAAIVYMVQLCLALTLGLQVYEVLKASIGTSLELRKLLAGYDHTVLMDFLSVHGASITPLIGQLRWVLPVWLLFSVFLNGGMLACAAAPEQASWRGFWQGGAAYFFPFLKIALWVLGLALLWTALVLLPVLANLQRLLEQSPSEVPVVWGVLAILLCWLAGLGGLALWSVFARLHGARTGAGARASLAGAARALGQHKGRYAGLLLTFAAFQGLLTALYWALEAAGGMTSAVWVLLFFMVQQALVFFRLLVRLMWYAALAA